MASVTAISCTLCFTANEPADMVNFDTSTRLGDGYVKQAVCRTCAAAISESLINSDAGVPYRAPSNGDALLTDPHLPGSVLAGDETDRPLVLPGESPDEGPRGDRREPEGIAGGDEAGSDVRTNAESGGLGENEPKRRSGSHKK
jgi:hypothetical protein